MFVNINFFLAVNPFIDAYIKSDFLGKSIFALLIALSVVTWVIIIGETALVSRASKNSSTVRQAFESQKSTPLALDFKSSSLQKKANPFLEIYTVLKKQSLDLLNKNRTFVKNSGSQGHSYLSTTDIDFIDTHLLTEVKKQINALESKLFILSTIVTLAPFLGLLGTVWGILSTFSELQSHAGSSGSQAVIGGLSLALATTVLGLIDAIPALIGYNYLKNKIGSFGSQMEGFSTEALAAVELQYRQVDLKQDI